MGELIFWLIFQRHSTYDERLFCSTYSYDDEGLKFTSVLNRKKVKKILDNIFQHTIRPSIKNRFCNVDQLILNLEELQKELNIEEDLKDYTIRYNSFFVGREFELLQIEKSLNDNDIMFISGIAGIGKSELVKQYLRVHNKEYDHVLYWVFDGSFISMICNENSVTITNFSKQRNEKDISYCFRKLKKIKEILEGFNNLMVIDNVDKFIEEIPHQEIWEFLQGLPCKIIVTTRNREDLFNCITISSITEMKYLMQIFYQYCIFEKEQSIYVEQIINAVNHHTFLIELIAKQTYAMHLKPIEMLKTLRKLGINSLPENNIRTYKDGKLSSGSIIAHLEKIFTFSKIDDNYIILLALLSFIPVEGYNLEKLCLFFSIENRNIFNWIISRGWANLTNEINAKISIHPTIALVTIDYIKKKTALIEKIYQIFLNSIEKKDNGLSYEDYIMLSESIVMSTYKKYSINNKYSAIFLTKYVEEFYHYGNIDLKFDIIKCAINIFEKNISWKKYCAIQELAYFLEAQILWHLNQLDDSIRISKEHLRMSKINNDLYFSARWCILISCIYSSKENDKKPLSYSNRYYLKSAYYALKMDKDLNKNKPKFMNSDYLLNVLDYDYIEKDKNSFADNLLLNYANWMENYVEMSVLYSKKEKTDIEYLKHALRLRRKIKEDRLLRNTSNSFNIVIDEAKIEYLNKNYKESEEKLQRIVQFYEQNSIAETTILCRVHYLLCHIALRKKQNNYKQAIIELNECIRISEKIKDYGSLSAKLELGNLYNETGKLNLSKDLNTFLWRETRNMSQEIKETFYANALYNMGKLFLLEKNILYLVICYIDH